MLLSLAREEKFLYNDHARASERWSIDRIPKVQSISQLQQGTLGVVKATKSQVILGLS